MNGKPTAEQKRFHDWCRDFGCIVSGDMCDSIHHIKGAKMKLKGVKGAGEWYILPLSYRWHQDERNIAAIHVNRKKFVGYTGLTEKEFWIDLIKLFEDSMGKKPMSEAEYQIIVNRA